ncbi:MAG: 50S ribosomal protein L24 [Planctomycetota bacterium]
MARHVRRGDTVMIRSGSDKGRTGKVLRVLVEEERVVVEGINVKVKHVKPTQQNPRGGGRTQIEMPVHISNVMPVDQNGKATRVRFETKADGSKVRLAQTTGEQLGPELKKAKA